MRRLQSEEDMPVPLRPGDGPRHRAEAPVHRPVVVEAISQDRDHQLVAIDRRDIINDDLGVITVIVR